MMFLKQFMFLASCCWADHFADIATIDVRFSGLYNNQDFNGLQTHMYDESAVLIPPEADQFVAQAAIAGFFNAAFIGEGVRDLTLTPTLVQGSPDGNALHELGVVSSTTVNGPYYVHWVRQESGAWKIDTDIMAVGAPPATLFAATSKAPAMNFRRQHDEAFQIAERLHSQSMDLYETWDLQGIEDQYAESAMLLPPDLSGFISKNEIGNWLAGLQDTLTIHPKLTTRAAMLTNKGSVLHDIYHMTYGGGLISTGYTRWARQASGEWKIETDITAVGVPPPSTIETAARPPMDVALVFFAAFMGSVAVMLGQRRAASSSYTLLHA